MMRARSSGVPVVAEKTAKSSFTRSSASLPLLWIIAVKPLRDSRERSHCTSAASSFEMYEPMSSLSRLPLIESPMALPSSFMSSVGCASSMRGRGSGDGIREDFLSGCALRPVRRDMARLRSSSAVFLADASSDSTSASSAFTAWALGVGVRGLGVGSGWVLSSCSSFLGLFSFWWASAGSGSWPPAPMLAGWVPAA